MDNLLRLYFALPEVRQALLGAAQDPQLGTDEEVVSTNGAAKDRY
jgi:hypothetical protein